ncbi:hypothetical protein JCM24511_05179 [Saitozyma sp. JCM 24511]|nr:hypothetical protein JCM24511_05179 [Saitozyma sp. JCM 24511]
MEPPNSFDGASHTSWLGVPSASGRGASSAAGSAIDVQVDDLAEGTLTVIALHPFYAVETNAGSLPDAELRMSIHLWTCDMSLTAELDDHPHALQDHQMISQFISAHSSFISNNPANPLVEDDLITLRNKFAAHLTDETRRGLEQHLRANLPALGEVDVRVVAADQVSRLSEVLDHWQSCTYGWPEDRALVDVVLFTASSDQQPDGDCDSIPDGSFAPGSSSG